MKNSIMKLAKNLEHLKFESFDIKMYSKLIAIILINIFLLWALPVIAEVESNKGTLIFLLDNSGSMSQPYNGDTKINSAKDSIRHALKSKKSDSMRMGLLELGGRCQVKELVNPISNDRELIIEALDRITPPPYGAGATPIAQGIARASEIFKKNPSPHKIVLVSDGEANCEGKNEFPLSGCDMVASLRNQNIKFELNLIGYGINGLKNEQAKCIAKLSDKVFKPKNQSELSEALKEVTQIKDVTNFFNNIGDFIKSITALLVALAAFFAFFKPKNKNKSNNIFWK